MFFEELRITNFKRFAGTNIFPLKGEGNVTIIAAKNGVGKTTVLDAWEGYQTELRVHLVSPETGPLCYQRITGCDFNDCFLCVTVLHTP